MKNSLNRVRLPTHSHSTIEHREQGGNHKLQPCPESSEIPESGQKHSPWVMIFQIIVNHAHDSEWMALTVTTRGNQTHAKSTNIYNPLASRSSDIGEWFVRCTGKNALSRHCSAHFAGTTFASFLRAPPPIPSIHLFNLKAVFIIYYSHHNAFCNLDILFIHPIFC